LSDSTFYPKGRPVTANRPIHARALRWEALALLAFFATRLATAAVSTSYRDVPVLPSVLAATRWFALAAAAAVLVAAAMAVLPAALERAPWRTRAARSLPALLVLLVAVGWTLHGLEIGTLGAQVELPVLGRMTFAQTWMAVTAVLALGALVVTGATHRPLGGEAALRRILRWNLVPLAAVCGGLALVAGWVAAAPPAAGPPGAPGGGEAPSLLAPLIVGLLATVVLVLAAASATTVAPTGAAAAEGEGSRDVPGMLAVWAALALIALAAIQLVPAARDNPSVETPVAWDSPETAALWDRTCAACHSHETRWPWYAGIAPGSWLISGHVVSGRNDLNVSRLDEMSENRRARLPDQLERVITSGRMPPRDFLLLHPEARLSEAERDALIQGLRATFAVEAP